MKKFIILIAGIFFLNTTVHQAAPNPNLWKYKYCAEMKNGKLTIMNEGKEMTADVTLANGTKIMMDGTVMMKDGTKRSLTDGECVNNDGKVITKEEMKNEKGKKKTSASKY
jgi:hypothetical protein